jgi:drug/metabolite transporter (DMT)-like permease
MRFLPLLAVVGSGVSFSLATVLAGMAFRRRVSVETVLLGRLLVGALVLWSIALILRAPIREMGSRAAWLLALGILPSAQSFLFYQSIARIPASVATLLLYTYPAIVTILAMALKRERVNRAKVLALGVSACGLVLVVGWPKQQLGTIGIIFGLLSAVAVAAWIVMADGMTRGVPPILSSALLLSGAAASFAIWSALTRTVATDGSNWAWTVPIGLVASAALLFLMVAIQHLSPMTIAIGSTVEPFSTTLLSALVLGETLGTPQVLGGLLIGVGVLKAVRAIRVGRNGRPE